MDAEALPAAGAGASAGESTLPLSSEAVATAMYRRYLAQLCEQFTHRPALAVIFTEVRGSIEFSALEPYACGGLVQHYVARRHNLILPLLRIYVDPERMTRARHLVRYIRPRLGGNGTTFFWETLGLVLVEPERRSPRRLDATAPMASSMPERPGAIADGSFGYEVALLKSRRPEGYPFIAFT